MARSRRRCFTLLEMIIALGVLMVVVSLLAMAANAITGSWRRLNGEKDRFSALLTLDRTLDTMLGNIIPCDWPNEDGKPRPVFIGFPDTLSFAYVHRVNDNAEGGLRFVQLLVENEKLSAVYQSRPLIDPDYPAHLKLSALAARIDRVEFQYADWTDDHGLEWTDDWDPEDERKEIPLAILVKVFWLDGSEESWLRRIGGASYRERSANWQPQQTAGAL